MEISMMVTQIKSEIESISKPLNSKRIEANALRMKLGVLDEEIRKMQDKHDALKMALDSLELVDAEDRQVTYSVQEENSTRNRSHSRKPKRIGKFNPQGTKIGEWASINQCAKDFGWGNGSMKKYIENTGKDKQIRIRGYYVKYIAA